MDLFKNLRWRFSGIIRTSIQFFQVPVLSQYWFLFSRTVVLGFLKRILLFQKYSGCLFDFLTLIQVVFATRNIEFFFSFGHFEDFSPTFITLLVIPVEFIPRHDHQLRIIQLTDQTWLVGSQRNGIIFSKDLSLSNVTNSYLLNFTFRSLARLCFPFQSFNARAKVVLVCRISLLFRFYAIMLWVTSRSSKITIFLSFDRLSYSLSVCGLDHNFGNFEFSTPYYVDEIWVTAFLSNNLPLFISFRLYWQVDVVEDIAWQGGQKWNLFEEIFLLLQASPINIVKHFLVTFFVHYSKHAISGTQNWGCPCFLSMFVFIFLWVFLDSKLAKTFTRTQFQHMLHQLVTPNKVESFDWFHNFFNLSLLLLDSLWNFTSNNVRQSAFYVKNVFPFLCIVHLLFRILQLFSVLVKFGYFLHFVIKSVLLNLKL